MYVLISILRFRICKISSNDDCQIFLQDINRWLDDAPKLVEFSSDSNSSVFHPSTSDSSRAGKMAEPLRKRTPLATKIFGPPSSARGKKIQRTIDRLQPGKSKGNLLLKKPLTSASSATADSTTASQATTDAESSVSRDTPEEPKLSLGTVLKNADSIQLICKNLVPSPNAAHLSNDEDEGSQKNLAVPKVESEKVKKEEAEENKEESKVGTNR